MISELTFEQLKGCFPEFPNKYLNLLHGYLEGEDVTIGESNFNEITEGLTGFTRCVLRGVCRVQRGHVVTYAELAKMIGRPDAVRAVASALGRNPLPVIIPCHRVIAKNGLGGYAFGLHVKRKLLDFESETIKFE